MASGGNFFGKLPSIVVVVVAPGLSILLLLTRSRTICAINEKVSIRFLTLP